MSDWKQHAPTARVIDESNPEEARLAEWVHSLKWDLIPSDLCRDGLIAWLLTGQPVGSFLEAVLANDLVGAFQHADPTNKPRLADYAQFLHWELPGNSWRRQNLTPWAAKGGMLGELRSREDASKKRIEETT